MKASIGRIVIFAGIVAQSNGQTTAPAIITSDCSHGGDTLDPAHSKNGLCVNLTVFPDCRSPVQASSVALFDTEEEARASSVAQGTKTPHVAWWPPRV